MKRGGAAKAVTDHLGRTFPSVGAMLERNRVSPGTYYGRLAQGMSPQQAVAAPDGRGGPVEDHLGNRYPNKAAMAKAWNVSCSTLSARLARGYGLEDALTGGRKPVKDHLGNEYPDMTSMAARYGQVRGTVERRLDRGWSLRDALTVPPGSPRPGAAAVKDHTGREFPSRNAMYEAWGTNKNTYRARVKAGMSMAEALETPSGSGPKPCRDHLGNGFPSLSAMCRHYGVDTKTFQEKLAAGKTMKEALSASRPLRSPCRDWSGREYPSVKALAGAVQVPASNLSHYRNRGRRGADRAAEEAVTNYWPGRTVNRWPVLKCVEFPWFLCRDPEQDICLILHADDVAGLDRPGQEDMPEH